MDERTGVERNSRSRGSENGSAGTVRVLTRGVDLCVEQGHLIGQLSNDRLEFCQIDDCDG